jgi:hypothetical protein
MTTPAPALRSATRIQDSVLTTLELTGNAPVLGTSLTLFDLGGLIGGAGLAVTFVYSAAS